MTMTLLRFPFLSKVHISYWHSHLCSAPEADRMVRFFRFSHLRHNYKQFVCPSFPMADSKA
ncbi:hypothetical protein IAD21_04562 [Abditibacteriota bacterium]|nr:hypothetical protein IAD21_04562 [Abditibacteriota bacterium]